MKVKRLTKKQVSFIASAVIVAIGGIYAFVTDFINNWQEQPPVIIETSDIEEAGGVAGDAIHAVGEVLGDALPSEQGDAAFSDVQTPDTAFTDAGYDTTGIIIRVVDGDTYCVDLADVKGDEEKGTKIRIIGVDTPESVAPSTYHKDNTEEGATVKDIVKDKIHKGDMVSVEYDVQRNDKYGRTLAYLYLSDGTMIEEWLLSNGYANIATYPPNVKHVDRFYELSHEAWENKTGLWNGFFSEEPSK